MKKWWKNKEKNTAIADQIRRTLTLPYPQVLRKSSYKEQVNKCWLWKGSVNKKGYAVMRYKSKLWAVHRISYLITNGPILSGMNVVHECANNSCINPEHLSQETIVRKRVYTEITPEIARKVRSLIATHFDPETIAKDYKLTKAQMDGILAL